MPEPNRVIEYAAHTNDIHTLRLEQNADAFRVIFPVKQTWVWIYEFILPLFLAFCKIATAIFIVMALGSTWAFRMNTGMNGSVFEKIIWRYGAEIIGATSLAVAFWIAVAAFNWRRYRKFAHEPRVFLVNREEIIDRQPGWLNMRQRHLAFNEIKDLRLKIYRLHFAWNRTIADLIINRTKGFRIRLRLSTTDPTLPTEIARRIAEAAGRPLR
jgi:hypothetical protein